jgi:hypothetical protein
LEHGFCTSSWWGDYVTKVSWNSCRGWKVMDRKRNVHARTDEDHSYIPLTTTRRGIKTVELAIPNYFKNTETPIVCYKYNKPTRNTIFNYNTITSDIQIVENTLVMAFFTYFTIRMFESVCIRTFECSNH